MLKIFSKKRLQPSPKFNLVQYLRPDGTFDYQKYKEVQTAANKRKINKSWAVEENIEFCARYVAAHLSPTFGLCHGTRRGLEQEWFSKYLNCPVIGTEISDTATDFPNTIQWDFHEIKDEWKNACSFIYSNALDHAYDPEKAIGNWMKCLVPSGLCLIEHSSAHECDYANETDPFGADIEIMPFLILKWGKGRFSVREILTTPVLLDRLDRSVIFVLQNHP